MAFQTGGKPKWFIPNVGDQMLSEVREGKSRKLAPPHYMLKNESDENVKKNRIYMMTLPDNVDPW